MPGSRAVNRTRVPPVCPAPGRPACTWRLMTWRSVRIPPGVSRRLPAVAAACSLACGGRGCHANTNAKHFIETEGFRNPIYDARISYHCGSHMWRIRCTGVPYIRYPTSSLHHFPPPKPHQWRTPTVLPPPLIIAISSLSVKMHNLTFRNWCAAPSFAQPPRGTRSAPRTRAEWTPKRPEPKTLRPSP